MRRILAAVVAVGLIIGALIIRNNRDAEKALGPYRLTCATELAEACRTLPAAEFAVTIEAAGITADRLTALAADADPGFDGWLSAGRWPAMVSQTRSANSLDEVTQTGSVLAHTHVAIAAWRERRIAFAQACKDTFSWKCIGDVAGRSTWSANSGQASWGLVKVALADPGTESAGLLGLAGATAGFTGSTEFIPTDLAQNDPYQAWLAGLARAIPRPPPGLASILATGPATADLYLGLDAEISSLLRTAARQGELEVVNLSPVLDVEAAFARATYRDRRVPDGLRSALEGAGWADRAERTTPLPSAGALAGLRRLWQETIR